jgi:hypothetical protein
MKEDLLNILVAANDPAATVASVRNVIYETLEKYRMDIDLNVVLCIDPSKLTNGITPFVVCHRLTDVVHFYTSYKCQFYITHDFIEYMDHAESIINFLTQKNEKITYID